MTRHLEESERALQERIFKMEGQRIQLEEVRVSMFRRHMHTISNICIASTIDD